MHDLFFSSQHLMQISHRYLTLQVASATSQVISRLVAWQCGNLFNNEKEMTDIISREKIYIWTYMYSLNSRNTIIMYVL